MSTITISISRGSFFPISANSSLPLASCSFFHNFSFTVLTFNECLVYVLQLSFRTLRSGVDKAIVCYIPADLFVEVLPSCVWWFFDVSSCWGDFNPRLLENHRGYMESDFLQRGLCPVHFWRWGWPEMPPGRRAALSGRPMGSLPCCPVQLSKSAFLGNSDLPEP